MQKSKIKKAECNQLAEINKKLYHKGKLRENKGSQSKTKN